MKTVVVIGASAGGLTPLALLIAAFRPQCDSAILVVMHIGAAPSRLPDLLRQGAKIPVDYAKDAEIVVAGRVYVAPPDHHMVLEEDHIRLNRLPLVHGTRPAANPLFSSAAKRYGALVVGIVLSGEDGDGADGLRDIKAQGGRTFAQTPQQARVPSMPVSAILADNPDIATVEDIAEHLRRL